MRVDYRRAHFSISIISITLQPRFTPSINPSCITAVRKWVIAQFSLIDISEMFAIGDRLAIVLDIFSFGLVKLFFKCLEVKFFGRLLFLFL